MHAAEIANKLKHINNNTNLEFFSIDYKKMDLSTEMIEYLFPETQSEKESREAEEEYKSVQDELMRKCMERWRRTWAVICFIN